MNTMHTIVDSKGRRFLLRVETSHDAKDYQKYEDIRNGIWGFPDDHLAGTRNMMCENFLAEGGSVFIGAFVEAEGGTFPTDAEHLAGFCYGFVGTMDKTIGFRDIGNLRFYSQYAGVKREYQAHGLGILIKEFQREIVRDVLGIRTVICTYDPLTGVNAYRNVHHFGMEVLQYRVATYGEYGGLLNRSDVATDRFLMAWDLAHPPRGDSAAAELPAAGIAHVLRVEVRRVRGKTSVLDLEVVRDADFGVGGDAVLVQIPRDFYEMLQETDVDDADVRRIPIDWRLHSRRAFQALFERGYRVVDFLKSDPAHPGNFYLLKRP